jgi:hypothetical protein
MPPISTIPSFCEIKESKEAANLSEKNRRRLFLKPVLPEILNAERVGVSGHQINPSKGNGDGAEQGHYV